ncbi:MAG: PAS domain S-box protein [candidate division Zixibacteria bacterium]|nr:PAS domain S-box protein [candidate division Zixibacteria bacterium]
MKSRSLKSAEQDRQSQETNAGACTFVTAKPESQSVTLLRANEFAPDQTDYLQANRFNSAQWERIFNSTANGMRVVDTQYRTVHVNDAFCRMIGASEEEIVGQHCYDCFPGTGCSTDNCPLKRITGGEDSVEHEVQKELPDGSKLTCIVTATALRDENGTLIGIIESFKNITRQREAEQARRTSEHNYRDLIEGTDNLVTKVDERGVFTFVNGSSRKVLGLEPKECIGLSAIDFVHPDDRERTKKTFGDWLQEKLRTATIENRQVSRTGDVRDMIWTCNFSYDEDGKLTEISSIARDITEYKLAKGALTKSEEDYKRLFNSSPTMLLSVDAKTAAIVEANESLLNTLGYTREEIIGRPVFECYTPESAKHCKANVFPTFVETGVIRDEELQLRRKDGGVLDVILNVSPVRDSDGNLIRSLSSWHDITERRQAQQKLQEAHDALKVERIKLENKNIALNEVLNQIETQKQLSGAQLQSNINHIILPLLQNIKEKFGDNDGHLISLLENALSNLMEPMIGKLEQAHTDLSPRELEICNMVKQGFSSKQIASILNVSVHTVNNQRYSIRKKFAINGDRTNLENYLKTLQ